MNLQPLIDLKDRLSHAAIAGTQLLDEDFRLKRAVEGIAPLAKASPVFQKIHTLAQSLFTAPTERRSGILLDVLGLVDAVIYTQGGAGCPGELIPRKAQPGKNIPIPYSRLQPLLTALTSKGSGRAELLNRMKENEPGAFSDARVLPGLIRALDDNHYEIALFAVETLREQGPDIVPLLKEGFDPHGKSEMNRRLVLIVELAGEQENDWYRSILPECDKNLKETVIYALGLYQQNAELLLNLSQTERGKLQEAALCGLARMETAEAAAYFREKAKKTPKIVLALGGTRSDLAAELTTEALRSWVELLLARGRKCAQEELTLTGNYLNAFAGQQGRMVREFWAWASPLMDQLHKLKPEKLVLQQEYSIARLLQKYLLLSILRNPCEELLRLGEELGASNPKWFCGAGFLAHILTPAADQQQIFNAYTSLLNIGSAGDKAISNQILTVLSHIAWHAPSECFRITYSHLQMNSIEKTGERTLPGFDPRWAIRLAELGVRNEVSLMNLHQADSQKDRNLSMDTLMMNLIDPRDEEACRVCGETLYHLVKVTGYIKPYYQTMIGCGWKRWSGLLTTVVQRNSSVNYYLLTELLAQLPMTGPEKAAELRRIDELVRMGQISTMGRVWPAEHIQDLIRGFEASNG